MSNRKTLLTALAVITILAVVFTMTPARAWASDFLGLFRVQRITVLEFDQLAAERSRDDLSAQQDAIERFFDENMVTNERGKSYEVGSPEEAAAAAGFTPRLPGAWQDENLAVQPGVSSSITIDQPQMQALLDAVGADVEISPEMDGQVVSIEVPDAVVVSNGCSPVESDPDGQAGCSMLFQLPSPTVSAPEGLNVEKIGEAMLQLLGLSEQEAQAFSQNVDWTTTLIIPIPSDEGIEYSEVPVDGVTGTVFNKDGEDEYVLVWVKNGIVYGLKGTGGLEDGIAVADSLQ